MRLEVSDLHFAYKSVPVLDGVGFSVGAGGCICVIGENGAGKTTLFRCLLGLLDGYEGSILIDGINAKKLSSREMARKIAYIPQAHTPVFNYTVFETVLMGTNVLTTGIRSPGRPEHDTTRGMLELMKISHLADRGFAELSGGERQLTLIARALAQKSHILIMDEPTANLDYGNQFHVMRQISQLAKSGYLVLLSTHDPEHALLFSDMVLILKQGKAMVYGKPGDVLTPSTIRQVYGVSVELQTVRTGRGEVPVFVPCVE